MLDNGFYEQIINTKEMTKTILWPEKSTVPVVADLIWNNGKFIICQFSVNKVKSLL